MPQNGVLSTFSEQEQPRSVSKSKCDARGRAAASRRRSIRAPAVVHALAAAGRLPLALHVKSVDLKRLRSLPWGRARLKSIMDTMRSQALEPSGPCSPLPCPSSACRCWRMRSSLAALRRCSRRESVVEGGGWERGGLQAGERRSVC